MPRKASPKISPEMRIRIKPYNEKRGHVVRNYSVNGKRYKSDGGWYCETDLEHLEILRQARQQHDDPESPAVFDICSVADAEAIDQAEYEAQTGRGTVSAPKVAATSPKSSAKSSVKSTDTPRVRRLRSVG